MMADVQPPPELANGIVSDHDLTIVIPAYNEESRLPKTLEDLSRYLVDWGVDFRVVVVDDGSQDRTAELAQEYGSRFRTISQPNGGKGSAIRNGMLAATGRIIAFTDADLPYDLAALKSAFQMIRSNESDVVCGSRDLQESKVLAERQFIRTLASSVFRRIVGFLVSREIGDTQCGLKIFSQKAARQIFSRTTINGFAFDAEAVFLAHRLNLRIQKVPVTLINEYASTISIRRNIVPMLRDLLRVRWKAMRGDYELNRPENIHSELTENPGVASERPAA